MSIDIYTHPLTNWMKDNLRHCKVCNKKLPLLQPWQSPTYLAHQTTLNVLVIGCVYCKQYHLLQENLGYPRDYTLLDLPSSLRCSEIIKGKGNFFKRIKNNIKYKFW